MCTIIAGLHLDKRSTIHWQLFKGCWPHRRWRWSEKYDMVPTGMTNVMPQITIIFNTDSPRVVLYYIFRSPGSTDLLGPAIGQEPILSILQ